MFDGFLVHSRGQTPAPVAADAASQPPAPTTIRTDLDTPVLQSGAEVAFTPEQLAALYPTHADHEDGCPSQVVLLEQLPNLAPRERTVVPSPDIITALG